MDKEISEKIPKILLRALGSTYTLYFASHIAHWNVEGQNFTQLHAIFKDIYDDAFATIDEIGEKIRQYDVKIPSTFQEIMDSSAIKASEEPYTKQLLELHEKLKEQWDSIAVVADAAEDSSTVDMAGKRAGVHSKFAWMLRSLLKENNS